jgi:hypothetical protein
LENKSAKIATNQRLMWASNITGDYKNLRWIPFLSPSTRSKPNLHGLLLFTRVAENAK